MASKLKILVLSQHYAPDIAGGPFRITETVSLLRSKGHGIRVITARPHRDQAEEPDGHKPDEDGVIRSPLRRMGKTIPSKVFDYMVGGQPILFGIEGERKSLLQSVPGNLSFQADDLSSLLDCLTRLEKSYEELPLAAQENRQRVKGFSRERMLEKLEGEIRGLF